MTDKDDAANLTMGPGALAPQDPPPKRSSRETVMGAVVDRGKSAIEETRGRRRAVAEEAHPQLLFWFKVLRNFVIGMPLFAAALWTLYQDKLDLDAALKALRAVEPHAHLAWQDYLTLAPGIGLLLLALCFLAPEAMEAGARFLGFGNLIDKIADRIPLLRPKPAAPSA